MVEENADITCEAERHSLTFSPLPSGCFLFQLPHACARARACACVCVCACVHVCVCDLQRYRGSGCWEGELKICPWVSRVQRLAGVLLPQLILRDVPVGLLGAIPQHNVLSANHSNIRGSRGRWCCVCVRVVCVRACVCENECSPMQVVHVYK